MAILGSRLNPTRRTQACLLGALAAFVAGPAVPAEPVRYPLTVRNCGDALRFDGPPERTVAIGQAVTETLYALGVGDRVAGTALWINAVLPEFAARDAAVPRLSSNIPSFESVVGTRPGLVATSYEWMIGKQGVVGTREQFAGLGIPAYVLPADCDGKNNLVGADGTRTSAFSIDLLYKGVSDLATIFDREEAGAALVAGLRAREAAAVARIKALHLPDASAVVWFSSADLARDPFVAGAKGVPGFMLRTLGIRNVVQSAEEWPAVGWETIARADPSLIVIARMDRRRYPGDDFEKKLAFLRSDPVTRDMQAVRRGRIVVLDAQSMDATIRMVGGLEAMAEAVSKLDQ